MYLFGVSVQLYWENHCLCFLAVVCIIQFTHPFCPFIEKQLIKNWNYNSTCFHCLSHSVVCMCCMCTLNRKKTSPSKDILHNSHICVWVCQWWVLPQATQYLLDPVTFCLHPQPHLSLWPSSVCTLSVLCVEDWRHKGGDIPTPFLLKTPVCQITEPNITRFKAR